MTTTDPTTWTGVTLTGEADTYRVAGLIGRGGMAYVFRATTPGGLEVAIKTPLPHLLSDELAVKRFTREVTTLQKLQRFSHPHVVRVLDVGNYNGLPFMVLPLLPGGSLRDRSGTKPQSLVSLRSWLPAIADALDAIHTNGTLHRDVKPDNILFDADGQPQLTDFGVVKGIEGEGVLANATKYTSDGGVLGSVPYMAPELIQGAAVTARTDQFALAVTVYEWLTGKVPFNGGTTAVVFVNQLKKSAISLDSIRADIPKSLAEAVMKGLALKPSERFANCRTLASTVLQFVPAPALSAPPPQTAHPVAPPAPSTVSGIGGDTLLAVPAVPPVPAARIPTPPASVPAIKLPPAAPLSSSQDIFLVGKSGFKPPTAPLVPAPQVAAPLPAASVPPAQPVAPKQPPVARRVNADDDAPVAERKPVPKPRSSPMIPSEDLPGGRRKPRPSEWWVRTSAGAILGPYGAADVRRLLDTGRIMDYDEISSDQEEWRTLGLVEEFAADDDVFSASVRRSRQAAKLWWIIGGVIASAVVLLLLLLLRK